MNRRAYIGTGAFVGNAYFVVGLNGSITNGENPIPSIGLHFDADILTFDADTHKFDEY